MLHFRPNGRRRVGIALKRQTIPKQVYQGLTGMDDDDDDDDDGDDEVLLALLLPYLFTF